MGRRGVGRRKRDPGGALLPIGVRHGTRRLLRTHHRQPRPPRLRAKERCGALCHQGRRRPGQRHWPIITASTEMASSTSHLPCPTSTSASRTPVHRVPTIRAEPHDISDDARHSAARDDRNVRRDPTHVGGPVGATPGRTCPATSRAPRRYRKREGAPKRVFPGPRPHRRQRRARQDGRVGRLLQPRNGIHQHGRVRRRRHRDRLLGADEQGCRERQPPREVSAQ